MPEVPIGPEVNSPPDRDVVGIEIVLVVVHVGVRVDIGYGEVVKADRVASFSGIAGAGGASEQKHCDQAWEVHSQPARGVPSLRSFASR